MNENLQYLYSKLENQYGTENKDTIIDGFNSNRKVTLRVNTIKSNVEEIIDVFNKNKINFQRVSWYKDAFILNGVKECDIEKMDIYKEGKIYLQNLSSMIPPLILDPKDNEDILDMAAAPGGKTTQISALSQNKSYITACEKNRIRIEKLKYNIDKQGAKCITIIKKDSRNLDEFFSFDKILLDSPCSGSGTILLNNEFTYKFFSENLVLKSQKVQRELLFKAINVLKKGKEMVYSTCSILKDENENIVQEMIDKKLVEIVPIDMLNFQEIPKLNCKLSGALLVCPNELYEGFFVVKLRKL